MVRLAWAGLQSLTETNNVRWERDILMGDPFMNLMSVLMVIREIGTDMSQWRSAGAFCSWVGPCPEAKISGGEVLIRHTRNTNNRASMILRLATWAAGKTDAWLRRSYRRISARHGALKGITATARKLACIIYHIMKYGKEFVWLDANNAKDGLVNSGCVDCERKLRCSGLNSKNCNRLHKCHLEELTLD